MSDDVEETGQLVAFKPGWPDIFPHGLIVARTSVSQRLMEDDEFEGDGSEEDDDDVRWVLHIGLRADEPRLALIADLTVTNVLAFGGVSVIMPFSLRDEPEQFDGETLDGLLRQYGGWAGSLMYDHAATVLRSALAGNGLPLYVPFGSPDPILHTSDMHPESATEEQP